MEGKMIPMDHQEFNGENGTHSGDGYNPDQTATKATAPAETTFPSQILMGTLKSTVSLNLPLSDFQALLFLGALFLTGGGEVVIGSDTSVGYL